MRVPFRALLFVGILVIGFAEARGVTLGQVDTFQNGTVQGWREGPPSPNPPTNVPTGGPSGIGDAFLRNVSSGTSGAGSRMMTFNIQQWAGNYTSAGVTGLEVDLVNLGNTPLHMRVALESPGLMTGYASTVSVMLVPGEGWQHATFDLTASGLSLVFGSDSLPSVRNNVFELRILSAAALRDIGDTVAGTIGIDNVRAVPEPGVLGLGALGLALRRRR